MTHGALMDRIYRNQRGIYDATRKYYLLGRDRMIAELAPPPGGSVLEIACGTGRNLGVIAQAHPQARLFGLDISEAMLETAARKLQPLGSRVTLARADATLFDPMALFDTASFDRIVMSYCLSMIPDWQGAVAEALRHLAPGGTLAIVDFGTREGLPRWVSNGLETWLAKFHVTTRTDLAEALRAAAPAAHAVEVDSLYRGYALYGRIIRAA